MDPYGAGVRGGNRGKRQDELEEGDQAVGHGAQSSAVLPSRRHGSNMKGRDQHRMP